MQRDLDHPQGSAITPSRCSAGPSVYAWSAGVANYFQPGA